METHDGAVNESDVWFLIFRYIDASPAQRVLPDLVKALQQEGKLGKPSANDDASQPNPPDWVKCVPPNYLQRLVNAGRYALNTCRECKRHWSFPSSGNLIPAGSLASALLRREVGNLVRKQELVNKELICKKLRHHRTFRGHSSAVYALAVDQKSRYVLTGSDDALLKIWSLTTGVVLNTCRGHEGEITDVKISCDSSMAASSSTDTVIRVWSLDPDRLGHPVSVLMGCRSMINYLDWNPIITNALASVSSDGSCCVWDALSGSKVYTFSPYTEITEAQPVAELPSAQLQPPQPNAPMEASGIEAAARAVNEAPAAEFAMLCCAWSRCGTLLAAGGNQASAFIWIWPIRSIQSSCSEFSIKKLQEMPQCVRSKMGFHATVPHEKWPMMHPKSALSGHEGDIRSMRFSHCGSCVATACADGKVRLFSRAPSDDGLPSRRQPVAAGTFYHESGTSSDVGSEWMLRLTLVCEIHNSARHQHRRNKPLKAPEVQQIVWGLDDKHVMAAVSDFTVRVFDSQDGKQLQVLEGHNKALYELAAHPVIPGIVATWSYDGTISIHDVETGQFLKGFDVRHTYPGRGMWCDAAPICLLDGCWTPSGDALLTTDVAGQLHLFSYGPADLHGRAHYDQFIRCEQDIINRDSTGAVYDVASGRLAHLAGDRRVGTLVNVPYEDPYQSLAARNALSQGIPIRDWKSGRCPDSVLAQPPISTAVEWTVRNREERTGDVAVQNALERCSRLQDKVMEEIEAGTVKLPSDDEPVLRCAGSGSPVDPAEPTPPDTTAAVRIEQRHGTQPASRAHHNRIPSTVNPNDMVQLEDSSDDDPQISSEEGTDHEYVQSDADDELLQVGRSQLIVQQRRGRRAAPRPHRPAAPPRVQRRTVRQPERNIIDEREEDEAEDSGDDGGSDEAELSDIATSDDSNTRRRGRRTQGGSGPNLRRSSRSRAAPNEHSQPARRSGRTRNPSTRSMMNGYAAEDESPDDLSLSESEPEQCAPPTAHVAGQPCCSASEAALNGQVPDTAPAPVPLPQDFRGEECYSWLHEVKTSLACFVPQVGEDVVYVVSLHARYVNLNPPQGEAGEAPRYFRGQTGAQQVPEYNFRPFELCTVKNLEYIIAEDSTNTLLKATLELHDCQYSSCAPSCFVVTIPPPLENFSEFVVQYKRFQQTALAVFPCHTRITCAFGGGVWYEGTVVSDKLEGRELKPEDIFNTPELIERFRIVWDDATNDDLSSWEIFAADADTEKMKEEFMAPRPEAVAPGKRLLAACRNQMNSQMGTGSGANTMAHLTVLPEPAFKAVRGGRPRDVSQKVAYNTIVPLPMSVFTILDRVENGWYRTLGQMRLDVDLLLSNAVLFFVAGRYVAHAQNTVAALNQALDAIDTGMGEVGEDAGGAGPSGLQLDVAGPSGLANGDVAADLTGSSQGHGRGLRRCREAAYATRHGLLPDAEVDEESKRTRAARKRRLKDEPLDHDGLPEEPVPEHVGVETRRTRHRIHAS